jgi:hypothetical protein
MPLTDRNVQESILRLLGALAAKVNGGPVAMRVYDDNGNYTRAVARESDIEWFTSEDQLGGQPAGSRESAPRPA